MRYRTIGAALGAALVVALAYNASAKAQSEAPFDERHRAMQRYMNELREGHHQAMQAHMKEHGMRPDPAQGTGRAPDDAGVGRGHADVDHASPPAEGGSPHH